MPGHSNAVHMRSHLILILTSLDLSFLICKMGKRIATSKSCSKDSIDLDLDVDIDVDTDISLNKWVDKKSGVQLIFVEYSNE